MPRRALRPLPTALPLDRYLVPSEAVPRPWHPAALFGREAPWEVEVGSGKGLFLSAAAAAQPERNFLGIEVARKYAAHAAARLARRELSAGRVIAGDALALFRDWFPDRCLSAVHVYFPDPWWKKRHHKRRVMNAAFLGDVERTLVPGGTLHFWTDVEDYYRATLELLREFPGLAGPQEVVERPAEHDLDYRTHFERRMRLSGLPVYRCQFQRHQA